MTPVSPGLSSTAVASLVRERKEAVIQHWRQRVLREVYAAGEQDRPALVDSLPDFLSQLAVTLEGATPAQQEQTRQVARKHGAERARLPDYTLGQVIYEYQVLREVLVEHLEQSERLAPEVLRHVHAVMDQAIREASVRFVEGAQEKIGHAERSTRILERLLDQIFASFTGAMAYFEGPDFVYTRVNTGYREILNGRELVGKPVLEAVPELATSNFPALFQKLFATGGTVFVSEERVDLEEPETGRVRARYFDGSYSRIEDLEGRPLGIFHFATEVTERVAARQEARRTAQALRMSEQRLENALAVIGAGVWEVDLTTQEVLADRRFREMFGLSLQESFSLAKGLAIIHPEDSPTVAAAVAGAIAGENGGSYEADYRTVPREDGSYQWVAARGQAYFDEQGKALRFLGTGVDITARKQVEALLRRQSSHHALNAQVGLALSRSGTPREMLQRCTQALVEQLEVASARIWLYDAEQDQLTLCGSAGHATPLDGPRERVSEGQDTVSRILQDRQPAPPPTLEDDASGGDREWARREGPMAFAGYPLRVGDKPVGVMALFSRQRLEPDTLVMLGRVADGIALGVERLRAEGELKTRVDFEQKLIGIVSHDLRNPLGAILMGASLLVHRETLDARSTQSLLRIQAAAERAERMVKDLLDFTQARLGGGLRIVRQPADLHQVTRAVVEEVEVAFPGRELDVRHEGDGQGDWDADRLGQVVQNLVTNALKYSPATSVVRVTTRAEEDGEVSLCVANAGPPIAADKLASIFEPMQRATADLDKAGRSVGLGLYIVKRIVDAHEGHIGVVSTPEVGTRFTVRLPRRGRAAR